MALKYKSPADFIRGAKEHLIRIHGETRAKSSLAWEKLEEAEKAASACIDDLIPQEWKDRGITCPCPEHRKAPALAVEQFNLESSAIPEPAPEPPRPQRRLPRPPHDFKAAASGEKEEE